MVNVIKSTSSEYIFEIINYDISDTFNPPGSQNNRSNLWQKHRPESFILSLQEIPTIR